MSSSSTTKAEYAPALLAFYNVEKVKDYLTVNNSWMFEKFKLHGDDYVNNFHINDLKLI